MSGDHRDLSPLDDFPFHQTSESLAHVATSDRNFYDRYYFNVHHCADDLFMALGVGQYPNLGVTDAFAAVVYRGGRQDVHQASVHQRGVHQGGVQRGGVRQGVHRVVRSSRELGADRSDTSVGPFRVEVLEPLNRLRVVLEPGEYGLSFDLTWTGSIPAVREPRQFIRRGGRVWMDSVRLAQTGFWEGTLRVGGDDLAVTPDSWWGSRDRSWGIRPVGEAEPAGIHGREGVPPTFHWVYAPMQFEDFSILVIAQEDEDGGRVLEEAVKVFRDGRPAESLGRPELELRYTPGTRDVQSARVAFAGRAERVRVTQLIPLHMAVGSGYGLDSDWRHGMYQGPELVVQEVVMPAEEAAAKSGMFGITERLSRFEYDGPEGVRTGYGLFETLFIGAHRPSGFADWLAVAL